MAVTSGSVHVPKVTTSMRHRPEVVKQGLYEISSEQLHMLGSRLEIGDGRVFYYTKAGAANLVACKMNEGAAPEANHLKCAVAEAVSPGYSTIKLTLGATLVTLNEYAEGYLNIDNGGGGYTSYKIKGHAAGALSTTVSFNLYDPVQVALTGSMFGTLTKNPWKDVVVAPASAAQAQLPVGVNSVAVTAAYFFWCQTWGPCSCLLGAGPPAISDLLMTSAATAGALIVYAVTASRTPVGILMRAEAAADYGLVFLTIAP